MNEINLKNLSYKELESLHGEISSILEEKRKQKVKCYSLYSTGNFHGYFPSDEYEFAVNVMCDKIREFSKKNKNKTIHNYCLVECEVSIEEYEGGLYDVSRK